MSIPEADDLWMKAKLFINRALEDPAVRDFPERAFWAAGSLELLGKAALARVSPILIATPDSDGRNLLAAMGLVADDGTSVQTVPAKTLWTRCHHAYRPFDKNEALKISYGRNEYVHGAGTGVEKIPEPQWWANFWAQAVVLLDALDRQLSDFVGPTHERSVQLHIEARQKHVEDRVASLIARAKQRLTQKTAPSLSAALQKQLNTPRDLSLGLAHRLQYECPVCKSNGLIEGDEISAVDHVSLTDEPEGWVVTIATVYPEYFSCENCGLILDGDTLLTEAGLDETFEVTNPELPDYEMEYGND